MFLDAKAALLQALSLSQVSVQTVKEIARKYEEIRKCVR